MRRIVVIVLAVSIIVVVASALAIRSYLHSKRVADRVTAELENFYGGPLRMEGADIGMTGTTFRGLALYETGADDQIATPWLKCEALTTDLSLTNLISGHPMPKRVTLQGAVMVLRFDKEGSLLTRFPVKKPTGVPQGTEPPGGLPDIVIEGGEIVLRKEGQPELAVKEVDVHATFADGRITVSGTGKNAELGTLITSGSVDAKFQEGTAQLKTDGKRHVTQAFLDRIPFVPPEVWREIQIAEADTTAELTVRYDRPRNDLHYRLQLAPENARLSVPALELSAHAARAKVSVEDNRVQVREFEGQAFDGTIRADADLDFRGETTQADFSRISVADLKLSDLPEEWNMPAILRNTVAKGRLTGNASLELTILARKLTPLDVATAACTLGTTQGAASAPWLVPASLLAALPANEVRVKSQGKGKVRDPASDKEPIDFDWQLSPRRVRTGQAWLNELHLASLLSDDAIVLAQEKKAQPDKGAKPARNYVDLNLNLNNVSLADLGKNFQIKLPAFEGKASLKIKASLPSDRFDDIKAYKANGSVEIKELVFAGLKLDALDADFTYADGVLYLKSLRSDLAGAGKGKDAGGTLRGSGQMQIEPLGELQADLVLDRVPVAELAAREKDQFAGALSGHLKLRAAPDKQGKWSAPTGEAKLTGDKLKVYGVSLEQLSGTASLADGFLRIPDLRVQMEGRPLTASAQLRLDEPYPFDAKLDLQDWDLAALQKLAGAEKSIPYSLAGSLAASAAIEGTLNPFIVKGSGQARSKDLKVDNLEAQELKFDWATDGKKLELNNLESSLYGGKATGSLVLPVEEKGAGKADLTIKGVETRQLAKQLRVPFSMEGKVDGTLQGTLRPAEAGKPRSAAMNLDLKASSLRVRNIPTQQLHGTVNYQNGLVDYKLEGKALGGTFDLEGQVPAAAKPGAPLKKSGKQGKLSIQGAKLRRLFQALEIPNADALAGAFDLDLQFTHAQGAWVPTGKGTLRLRDVRFGGVVLADSLRGDLALSDEQVRLRNFSGELADGRVSLRGAYYLKESERSWFSLSLDDVESAKLLGPWLKGKIEGPLQARVRGNRAEGWRGSADLELTRGKVLGMEVGQWHIPATWSYSATQARGQLDIHETNAQIARGRAVGKLNLAWDGASARVEGNLRFSNVDVQNFLRQISSSSQLGAGQATGHIEFAGSNVRSLDDLGANMAASFKQAQALQLPVLQQVAPYLGVGTTTTFQQGDLRAKLDRGVIRIQQLTLDGSKVQLHVEGNMTLAGRLSLDVLAKTGNVGLPTDRLRFLGLRVPIAGPVPLAMIVQVSNLLSNRLIYLQVTGTPASPVVRPRPVPILTQTAVRYFLDRANLPVPVTP